MKGLDPRILELFTVLRVLLIGVYDIKANSFGEGVA